jgi:molybdopterin-containing oxidoreductase family membrane subunit
MRTRIVPTSAHEASVAPFGRPSRLWWATIAGLTAVVAAGVVAWVVQLRGGMAVAGYQDHAFWAIYIADVITFIGVSYGGAVVSAILRLTGATWRAPLTRLAEGTAVVTVLIGTALIVPHIATPIRLWELVTRPNLSAPVFWDFVAVMTYTAASIVFFALPLVPDMAILRQEQGPRLGRRSRLYATVSRGWASTPQQRRVLTRSLGVISVIIIPLAVSVHSVLAWAFSSTSRPWWHESVWAPQFVVAALYSGVALVILVVAGFRRGYHLEHFVTERHFVRLGFILSAFSATYLYLTFSDLLPGGYVGDRGTAAVFTELLVGRLAVWFWMFVVLGGVLPLLLVALPRTRNLKGMVLAAVLVVLMMWVKRILMVVAPATYDTMTGAFSRYHYTWVPVLVTAAAAAAIPLMLMLLFRVVPLLSIHEIDEIEEADVREAPSVLDGRGADEGEVTEAAVPATVGNGHRKRHTAGTLLLVALLGVLGLGSAGRASAAPQGSSGNAPSITVTGAEVGLSTQLTATLRGKDARPLPGAEVAFFFSTTEFGTPARLVPLGSVSTDKTGVARLRLGQDAAHLYQPATVGPEEFTASYTPKGADKAVSASTTVNVAVAHSAYHPAPAKPLAGVGDGLVVTLFAIVAAVWTTLGTQLWRVRRSTREVPARVNAA